MLFDVAAFYKFVAIDDTLALQERLKQSCVMLGIKGTILLAPEGINATISGAPSAMCTILDELRRDDRFADLTVKISQTGEHPFRKLRVRLRKEIITLGVPAVDPTQQVGTYVAPGDWNALISNPDVVVVDTRNAYEAAIGTFAGAIDPKTESFSEFPAFVKKTLDPEKQPKVAMFCTGGIRCEKASAYMLAQGFREVYHLKGGILDYLAQVPADQSLWQGDCFVFDRRVALTHGCVEGEHIMCFDCGYPYKPHGDGDEQVCPHCQSPAGGRNPVT